VQLSKRLNGEAHILGGQFAEVGALSFQQMKALQIQLNAKGYDTGEPDGFPGMRTQDAVRAFQLAQHLPADGYASPNLFNYLKADKDINKELILKLHSILLNGIRDDAGFFRNHGVRIVGSNVPTANYPKLPELMDNLINDINKNNKDSVALVVSIHSRFEQIHPFADGNGRIGRLIMMAMLIKVNFPPAVIKQEVKRQYYNYLSKAQLKGEFSQLEDFICEAIFQGFDIINRK